MSKIIYPTGGKTEFEYELNEFRSIEKEFNETTQAFMIANQCDVANCNCTSFPSNNVDFEPIEIENFFEFFKSDIRISAVSNLLFQSQPLSCAQSPSFTL